MKTKIKNLSKVLKVVLGIFSTALFLTYLNFSETYAQEKITCTESLKEAEANYNAGDYQESIRLVNKCLAEPNIPPKERGEAYRIMALVDLAIHQEEGVKDAVKNLILIIPNYKYDPDRDPAALQPMIEDALQQITPSIEKISPNSVEAESDAIILTVDGLDFVYGSIVQFNNKLMTTTYLNQNQLTAEIQPIDLEKEGEYEIRVYSPVGAGKTSNGVKFTVTGSSSFPWSWIAVGGGVVAAAVVAVLLLGSDNDETEDEGTLPTPPGRQ